MTNLHIYAFGHALVDEEYSVSDAFLRTLGIAKNHRTLIDYDRCRTLRDAAGSEGKLNLRSSGGAGANTLATAALLGSNCHFSCLLSNDEEGLFYLKQLKETGIASDEGALQKDAHTGVCLVMLTPDANRTMNTYVGITDYISADNINHEALAESEWLYIEGHLLYVDAGYQAAVAGLASARKHKTKTVFNFCDPAVARLCREKIAELLFEPIDLLFCNEEEAMIWSNSQDLEVAMTSLDDLASKWVLTLGEQGAIAFDGAKRHIIPAHDVVAVSTLGAGDTFAGAFLYGLISGMDFKEAGMLASQASAILVQQAGPRLNGDQLATVKNIAKISYSQ